MFIITAKVPRPHPAFGVAIAALLCCAALVLTLTPPSAQTAAPSVLPDPKGIRTATDRVEYLAAYGWEVAEPPVSTQELLIPEIFDESYQQYLQLQQNQGFDLEACAGKRVHRYTYEILNYPTGETGVLVNLLICKKTVVGGEVLSPRLDGFLHGLNGP